MEKVILTLDISHDDMFDGHELKIGQDVTQNFAHDIARPTKATITNPTGPGGGNPIVELEFIDEDQAWEWWINNYDEEGDDELFYQSLATGL